MPSERKDDELAVTATAPGAKEPAPELGATLGRYRLERELGAGGMGVVHAAFDPDLERRVALKVLRKSDGGDEARQRLLREARALARLTHTNVVTVHEVGSANGRDFVAMELIEGETLADWMRSAPRDPDEILAAFIAAGRGLAAAHAAGLVHRDFKPHNVLRRKDGRIVVTDFGLARGVEIAAELEATLKLRGGKVENTPSSLSGLTETGSVLGTPAYMAPEQWSGGPIGPPADQFAFCVALWEALAGERPFRGDTLDKLKNEVHRGPAELDVSKLPRHVRAPLVRGLDPDPTKRWPSIDALLAAIARPERKRRGIALAIAASAVVVGAAGYAIATSDDDEAKVAQCEPAALDPAVVWSPAVRAAVAPDIAQVFDKHVEAWRVARGQACTAPSALRARRLPCLDGVLVRLDAVRKSLAKAGGGGGGKATIDDVGTQLIDPAVCAVADPPRLPTKLSDAAAVGLALSHTREPPVKPDDSVFTGALAKANDDPCARSLILLAKAEVQEGPAAREAIEQAAEAAEACGDDRTRAEALLAQASGEVTALMPKVPKSLAAAEAAVRKVSEPDLAARVMILKGAIAGVGGQYDEQIKLAESALQLLPATRPRGRLRVAVMRIGAMQSRRKPGDLEASRIEIAKWRKEAERANLPRVIASLDVQDCLAQWLLGDIEGAHARYPELRKRLQALRTEPPTGGETINGTVVDATGKPVAGAMVVANSAVVADSLGIGLPFNDDRVATTDAAGRFKLEHVSPQAIVVAQHGKQRSRVRRAQDGAKLVLAPTTKLAGRVVAPNDSQFVFAISGDKDASALYQMIAPIRADGTFTLEGVPIGKLRLGAFSHGGFAGQSIAMQDVTVGAAGATNIEVKPRETRKLRVVVRSAAQAPLTGARVFVAAGTVSIKTGTEMERVLQAPGVAVEQARALTGETPPELALKAGDLVATFASAPTGAATACALGFTGELTEEFFQKLDHHLDKVEVRCTPVAPDAKAVTVEVPPMKRFD